MKQTLGTFPSRNIRVSISTHRSSPPSSSPSTPLDANLRTSGTHSSPPNAPRRKGTLGSIKRIMGSPPSPSPRPRHRAQPIPIMRHSPSTPSSWTLSSQPLPGKKISRERLLLTSTQSSNPAYSRLKAVPSADSTILSEHPHPQRRSSGASMPAGAYPPRRGTNALSGELSGDPTSPQSQRVGISRVRSTGAGRPPILQKIEGPMRSEATSNITCPSFSLARGTETPKKSLIVPGAPHSANKKERRALPYKANLPTIGSQSDVGQTGDITVISRVPALHSFSTQTPRVQFPTRRSAPLQSEQREVLVPSTSHQPIQSSPSAQRQARKLFTQQGGPPPTGPANSLAPNLSFPVIQSSYPKKPARGGLYKPDQLVRSVQSLNQNVERSGGPPTRLGPMATQSPRPKQGGQNKPHAVKSPRQFVDTPPAHRGELGSGSASPDPLSIEALPSRQVQQTKGIATSLGSQAKQPPPLRRSQQTRGNNTSPDPLSVVPSPLGLSQPTKSPAVRQFASSLPFLLPKPAQETHGIISPSTIMQSSPIRGPGTGQPITSQTARGDRQSSSFQSSQIGVLKVLRPKSGILSSPLQLRHVGVNLMGQSPVGLPPPSPQVSASATSAVPNPELPLTPPAQQIGAISMQVPSASQSLMSHPQPRQKSDQVTSVALNTSLQAGSQAQQTETSKDGRAQSSAFPTSGLKPPPTQCQSSNLDPRGTELANSGLIASFPSRQQPGSSPRSSSNLLLPISPAPNKQQTGARLNPAQNIYLRNGHSPTSHHGSQSVAIPSLPQNLYPSHSKGRQKRRLDTENDTDPNPKAKRQAVNQNANTNPALDRSNVPAHGASNSSHASSTATRHPVVSQRMHDLEKKIKGFTDIHGEKQSIVVAISGCTSSGKTTLVNILNAVFSGMCSQPGGHDAELKETADAGPPSVRLVQQENFVLPAEECPKVSWTETVPYTMPVEQGQVGSKKDQCEYRAEEYWTLAYRANVGINPQLIMGSPYAEKPCEQSLAIASTEEKSSPNKDSRDSINWGALRANVAAAALAIRPGVEGGSAESMAGNRYIRQPLRVADSALLEGLRNRVKLFIHNQTQQNLRAKFGGRLVVNDKLKSIILLEGSLLYVCCEEAVQLMNMCDSKLFLPTSMKAARERRLKKLLRNPGYDPSVPSNTEGYFDHVAWPQYKKEHDWLYQSNDPGDPAVRIRQICLTKNIFVCPKLDESVRNTAAWAVQMTLVSIAMAEHRARLAFIERNGTIKINAMRLSVERPDPDRSSPATQAAGQERSGISGDKQASCTSRLSVDCGVRQELKAHTHKAEKILNGQAGISEPHEASGHDSWIDQFMMWA